MVLFTACCVMWNINILLYSYTANMINLQMPYLTSITLPFVGLAGYPFDINSFKQGINLRLKKNVTFFVDENGSGKSTLLEAIAEKMWI